MIPRDMMRERVLLCLGEEGSEFAEALGQQAPRIGPVHRYRAFQAGVRDDILCISGAVGSAVVEKCLWEILHAGVKRVILVGTAGSMPGFQGDFGVPYEAAPAWMTFQNFEAPPRTWTPSLETGLPQQGIVSSDRFYGFSTLLESDYPAEPGLLEAWHQFRDQDLMVDMEVAAFYHYCEQFGDKDLQFTAIKAVANRVDELDKLPEHSAAVLDTVVAAAWKLF